MRTDTIAHLYADPGPFASCYVDVSRGRTEGRVGGLVGRDVVDRLADQGAPDAVCALIRERLERAPGEPAPISRCIVASERGVLLDRLSRHQPPQPVAYWGRLPELTRWLTDASSGVAFTLALVDHEGADVMSYAADGIDLAADASVGESSAHVHKVKGGGWAQFNWQRSTEEVWRRNAAEAATEIERQVRSQHPELVLIAGDERSRGQVAERLGDLPVELVVLDRAGRASDGGDDALAVAVEATLRERVVHRRLELVHELADRVGRGWASAVGLDQVTDAFVRGQVEHLLLDRDNLPALDLVTGAHPGFGLGGVDAGGTLPADQALIAAAAVTGAQLDFAGSIGLHGAPVAALLRWDQPVGSAG